MSGPNDHESPGGAEAVNKILACAERTLAAGSARVMLHLQWKFPPGQPGRGRRRSTTWRVATGVGKLVFKAWLERMGQGGELGHLTGTGFIEPGRGRYMIDCGAFALLFADGKLLSGRSGRPLRTLPPHPVRAQQEKVFWLLKLLPGTTNARQEASETLHGTVCQKLAAHVDMARASAASGAGLHSPAVERFEDLQALPVTVWIDGQHIRRIEFQPTGPSQLTALDLWDFGVPVDELDWSRLPTFRSPGDAGR